MAYSLFAIFIAVAMMQMNGEDVCMVCTNENKPFTVREGDCEIED